MKKPLARPARPLALSRETVRPLSTTALVDVAGCQARRTITCNEECDSYACFDTYC
jgi:hypothetical protein